MKHSYRYSESSRKTQNFNYGQLLYEKGLEFKETQRNNSEKKLQEKENLSTQSFHPVISKNSIEIAKNSNRETRIKRSQDLIEKLKSTKEEQEMKECYFVPMISERSKKHSRKNVFSELYKEGIAKRKNSEEMKKMNKTGLSSKISIAKNDDADALVERLYSSKVKTEVEIEKLRNELYSDFDKQTGQKLFFPNTGKKENEKSQRNIWEELYYFRTQNKKNEPETVKETVQTSEKTEKLFEKLKKNRFQEIFLKMDSDHDGKISAQSISIEGFDRESVLIMAPVLEEIEKSEKEFEVDEFSQMMEGLYGRLGTHEKMFILKHEQEKIVNDFSFTPTINKRSQLLASSPHLGNNIFYRTQAAKEIKQMKMKKIKEIKEKERNEKQGSKKK
jgi:hypothetical protein